MAKSAPSMAADAYGVPLPSSSWSNNERLHNCPFRRPNHVQQEKFIIHTAGSTLNRRTESLLSYSCRPRCVGRSKDGLVVCELPFTWFHTRNTLRTCRYRNLKVEMAGPQGEL